MQVIPNGVAIDRSVPASAGRPVRTVLTVANLRPEKAHEILLEAAALLAGRHPNLRFLLAGDGPRRPELAARIASLGLGERVGLLGHRDDVPALLAQADVFVLPSRSEAYPNAAIEAMAAGRPVVASGVGGLLDLIDHDRTGLLVPPDDPAALAGAIDALVSDPARAARLGAAAAAESAARHGFDRMVRAFEALYLTHLELAGARSQPAVAA